MSCGQKAVDGTTDGVAVHRPDDVASPFVHDGFRGALGSGERIPEET